MCGTFKSDINGLKQKIEMLNVLIYLILFFYNNINLNFIREKQITLIKKKNNYNLKKYNLNNIKLMYYILFIVIKLINLLYNPFLKCIS